MGSSPSVASHAEERVLRGVRLAGAMRSIGFQLFALEAFMTLAILGLFALLEQVVPGSTSFLHMAVAAILATYAVIGIAEAIAAVRWPPAPPIPEGPLPDFTAIIAAYLPNEAPIILETVEHHLSVAPPNYQLIVAYNTPEPLPIEADLHSMAAADSRLLVLNVEGSRSKAENVNAALDYATGEIIGCFDADHHPIEGSFQQAWRWLHSSADVVQGRCAVRRDAHERFVLPALVGVELEQMYSVGHAGRTRLYGLGLFGGSNGYWRAEALRAIKFDPSTLTEDIDASVRLLRSGGRIVTDPSIVSTEMAPPNLSALCHQRLRWAQGWLQVRLRHLKGVLSDEAIEGRTRFGVGWTFGVGSVAPWLGAMVLPLMIDGWFDPSRHPQHGLIRGFLALGTAGFLFQIFVAYRHSRLSERKPFLFLGFFAANAVFYAYLRTALVRLSHVHEFAGRDVWRVTPRS